MEDSKQALSISLVSPSTSGLTPVAGPFHPVFTYSIFGDDEKIFGYKGLKMNLRFRAYDMKPHLQTSFSQKLKAPPGVDQPTDVAALLEEGRHLPKSMTKFQDQSSNRDHRFQLERKIDMPFTQLPLLVLPTLRANL